VDSWATQHRAIVLRRTGGACAFCGAGIHTGFGRGWTIARWVDARDLMGAERANTDVPGNLWPVCAPCADEKGDMDGREYVKLRLERGSPVHPRWQAYAKIAAHVVRSDGVTVAAHEPGRRAV
jgi:hypothetical protein